MTEVDGPPVPAVRFSSLLIRGAETANVAGADEKALEVNCNMAQAFEIPRGNRTAHHDLPRQPKAGHRQVPSKRFPDRRSRSDPAADRQLEYGFGFGPPQAHQHCPGEAPDRPDSRFGNLGKFNRFWRI